MRILYSIISAVAAIVILSCSPSRPSDVLSQGEMEDVLYDMHLAQAVYDSREGRTSDADILALRASVLQKHDITQAEWDSSYNYYCRNAQEMYAVYKRLSERLDRDVEALGGQVAGVQGEEADTANVWRGESAFILMHQPPYNLHTFSLTPDSTFRDGDRIQLQFDAQLIFQDGMRDITTLLAVYYERSDSMLNANPGMTRDSVATSVSHLNSEGHGIVTIDNQNDRLHVKAIKGYFMLAQNLTSSMSTHNQNTMRLAAIRNVKLLHLPTEPPVKVDAEEEKKDSVRPDSVIRDSVLRSKPIVINHH